MRTRLFLILLLSLLFAGRIFAVSDSDLQVMVSKPGTVLKVERQIDETRILLSASDADKKPIFGLTVSDFVVKMSGKTAKITSVQPAAESLDVPRNIVMVLDNSDSMRQRNAIEPLLAGVDELLKIVRPIDQVQIVVFSKEKMNIGGRDLNVRTFKSNKPHELKNFVTDVYHKGITSTTVLYDAMLAGLELIRSLPANEPRFMVVFSDGEDLNSDYKSGDVLKAMEGLARFNAYAIDYMPGPQIDEFLATFAERNNGEIWKATSEANLVPIFQSVASKMQYYYVVSYLFPTTGHLTVAPANLAIDEISSLDALGKASVASRIDASALTLRPVIDTVYGISSWKLAVANGKGTLAEQSGKGTPPQEIVVPFKTDDLGRLAAGGDIKVEMDMQDGKGQNVTLTAAPVKVNYYRTKGSLTVTPASLAIDEIENFDASAQGQPPAGAAQGKSASVISRIDVPSVTLKPVVESPHGITFWKLTLANAGGILAEQSGKGTPPLEIVVPLKTDDLGRLVAGGDIRATMDIQDSKGQSLVLSSPSVKINHFRTTGSLAVSPATLTIEEIKTIDASPMLGQIYFSRGSSDLPEKYIRLSPGAGAAFDEQSFRDTLEKYHQVLNIIGKRMIGHPETAITLTGCNDNTGVEKGNLKLSTRRAEAVRDYLQVVWGIAPERIRIEARNLPKMPSTSRLEEGREENRRVEISSENPAILGLIRSTYLATRIDTATLTLSPDIKAPHGTDAWTVAVSNGKQKLGEFSGKGAPPAEVKVPLNTGNLKEMAAAGDITVKMTVQDRKGQELAMTSSPVRVNFIQTSQLMAEKKEFRVQEKYALILFDFDNDKVDARNQEIVNAIVGRVKELPNATVDIVGHTDNIGKEDYNINLSKRRALTVYNLLKAAYGENPGDRLSHDGVGPSNPLYDNTTSEARAFNRTVTITLEYLAGN